jgi:predicted dehydrogenase
MADPIRVGFLGIEHIHADFWQEVFQDSPHTELVGAWAITPGLTQSKGEELGYKSWDDRDALLNACDAIVICAPTTHHAEMVELSARAGKKILLEKPMASSVEDLDRIGAVLDETGAWLMQAYPKRYDPINVKIRSILDSGDLGTLSLMRIRHGHAGASNPVFGGTWYTDPELAGGGTMMDEGSHAADFVRRTFGDPEEVSCFISSAAQGYAVEDTGIAIYKWANGLIGEIVSCFQFHGGDNSIEVYGTQGAMIVSGVDLGSRDLTETAFLKTFVVPKGSGRGGKLVLHDEKEWTISDIVPQFKRDTPTFHKNVASAFVDALVAGDPPSCTYEDGRRASEMIIAAYESAKTGRAQKIVYG